MSFCKTCNDVTETLYSDSRGETYCTRCGAVLEENRIVEAVTFTEGASGAVRATGQFIPSSGFGTTPSGFAASYGSRESREQALQRGYANIQRIANRLHLSLAIIEAAQRIYLMGVQRNFIVGRITSHVASACLYTSCRREKAPQMLIDFSDILCTPVRTLGRVFVKLIRVLHIDVPTIDPSLYMERFAAQMPLEDKTQVVAQTGVRLVQAMTRDWICTGRRPTGLCGAALLVAARFHGFKINPEDVSTVIRMSSSTVNKRLNEFKHTSTAQLKAAEFESADLLSLPILRGPPCTEDVRASSKLVPALPPADDSPERNALPQKEALLCLPCEKEVCEESSDTEADRTSSVDEANLCSENSMVLKPFRTIRPLNIDATSDEICVAAPSSTAIAFLADRLVSAIEYQVDGSSRGVSDCISVMQDLPKEQHENGDDDEDPLRALLLEVKEKASELVVKDHGNDGVHNALVPFEMLNASGVVTEHSESCNNGLVVQYRAGEVVNDQATLGSPVPLDESLSDVSDTEINALLLSEDERQAKALMWDELMKDVMPEVHRRWKMQKRKEVLDVSSSAKRLKRLGSSASYRSNSDLLDGASSAADSVRLGLEVKNPRFAKRLPEGALDSLFSDDVLHKPKFERSDDTVAATDERITATASHSACLASLFV